MKYIMLTLFALYLGFAATPSFCGEKTAAAQTKTEEKIEQAVAKSANIPPRPLARFAVINDDIVSWEENAQKHYIFVSLSDEKSRELSALTVKNTGQPLQISVDDNFFYIPAITDGLAQKNGFVLPVPDGRSVEIMRLFDRAKQKAATTPIDLEQTAVASAKQ